MGEKREKREGVRGMLETKHSTGRMKKREGRDGNGGEREGRE